MNSLTEYTGQLMYEKPLPAGSGALRQTSSENLVPYEVER